MPHNLFGITFLSLFLFTSTARAEVAPEIDTPGTQAILTQVETAYNATKTLEAEFAQYNSKMTEDLQTGTLYLKKPGKMRLVYEKGSPLAFYANDGFFIYHDKSAEEVSYFELDQTPVAFILKERLSFTDPGFVVTDVQEILDEYFISIHKKGAKELGILTLVFDKESGRLKQWDILDMQGVKSTVSLFNIKENIPVDNQIFLFHNPYSNS